MITDRLILYMYFCNFRLNNNNFELLKNEYWKSYISIVDTHNAEQGKVNKMRFGLFYTTI